MSIRPQPPVRHKGNNLKKALVLWNCHRIHKWWTSLQSYS